MVLGNLKWHCQKDDFRSEKNVNSSPSPHPTPHLLHWSQWANHTGLVHQSDTRTERRATALLSLWGGPSQNQELQCLAHLVCFVHLFENKHSFPVNPMSSTQLQRKEKRIQFLKQMSEDVQRHNLLLCAHKHSFHFTRAWWNPTPTWQEKRWWDIVTTGWWINGPADKDGKICALLLCDSSLMDTDDWTHVESLENMWEPSGFQNRS